MMRWPFVSSSNTFFFIVYLNAFFFFSLDLKTQKKKRRLLFFPLSISKRNQDHDHARVCAYISSHTMSAECSKKKNSRRFPAYQKMSLSRKQKKKTKEREAPKEFSHYGVCSIYIIGPLEITIKRDTLTLRCMYSETNKQKARHNNREKKKTRTTKNDGRPKLNSTFEGGEEKKKSKGGRETHKKKKKKNICDRNPRRGCCFHNA